MIPTIPNIDRSDVNNLDDKHPLVRRGWQNMDDGIFISKDRKKDLNRYQEPYFIQDDQTYFVIFIKDNRVDRWIGLIRLIMWRVRFMRELFGNKKELYIWLWPTSWKKRIPKKIFTEDDINSGSTSLFLKGPHAKKNGEIILWRKEEVLKVLVHEIIHAFRIDEKDPLIDHLNFSFSGIIMVSSNDRFVLIIPLIPRHPIVFSKIRLSFQGT